VGYPVTTRLYNKKILIEEGSVDSVDTFVEIFNFMSYSYCFIDYCLLM
jgi:hypothetical protein